jgi:hypothetical protein
MNQDAQSPKMAQIIAKCWSDAAFKAGLLADPVAVLLSEGLSLPAGIRVEVVEDTPQRVHWVLPVKPTDLSDAQLDALAGGRSLTPEIVDAIARGNVKRIGDPAAQLPNLIYGAWLR